MHYRKLAGPSFVFGDIKSLFCFLICMAIPYCVSAQSEESAWKELLKQDNVRGFQQGGGKLLYATGATFGDRQMKQVAKLKSLRQLVLTKTSVTDEGLSRIGHLVNLSSLQIDGPDLGTAKGSQKGKEKSGIHGAAFAHFQKLSKLEIIKIRRLPIEDKNLAALAKLPNLKIVEISNSPVTDQGVRELVKIPKVIRLHLPGTKISDLAVGMMSECKSLRSIDLSRTAVTDKGLIKLDGKDELAELYLSQLPITDEAMFVFQSMPKLVTLYLDGTRVTDSGANKLIGHPSVSEFFANGSLITDAMVKKIMKQNF